MLLISYILIIHLHIFHRLELFQIYRHLIFTNLNTESPLRYEINIHKKKKIKSITLTFLNTLNTPKNECIVNQRVRKKYSKKISIRNSFWEINQ